MKTTLLLTCEHGGRRVPAELRARFAGAEALLDSERGWDAGALVLARQLARRLEAPLFECTTTRLVIDLNRALESPRLFSEFTRALAAREREELVRRWWRPHREAVERFVRAHSGPGRRVLHVSVHSFAATWRGRTRAVDVGWLDDPARPDERAVVDAWLNATRVRRPELVLRRNQPYRGTSDGLTTSMRRRFDSRRYLGLELEVSQAFPLGPRAPWTRLRRDLCAGLESVLQPSPGAR